MSELQFNRARAVVYDPQYMNRQTTLGGLQTLGLTQIEPVARTSDLISEIASGRYDLVMAELQGGEEPVCDIVRRVRHRQVGGNPFLVILLTTWDLNADTVRSVLNSGADDLLARPYTIGQLQQRLSGAVLNRKPFVVTVDYVGPSRRTPARDADCEEVFVVPNPLRERVLQAESPDDSAREAAWRNVLRWKAVRLGRQLESAVAMLTKGAMPSQDGIAIENLVSSITRTASDLQTYALKAKGAGFEAVADHCLEMQRLLQSGEAVNGNLSRFAEVASQISDQVRLAEVAEREGKSAGVVPFYVA